LRHTSRPFCSGYFRDGVSPTICTGWPWTMILPISVSQVAKIIAVSHWHLACLAFLNAQQLLHAHTFFSVLIQYPALFSMWQPQPDQFPHLGQNLLKLQWHEERDIYKVSFLASLVAKVSSVWVRGGRSYGVQHSEGLSLARGSTVEFAGILLCNNLDVVCYTSLALCEPPLMHFFHLFIFCWN
jgi:hypothetical protein